MTENLEKQSMQDEGLNEQDTRPVYSAPQVKWLSRNFSGEGANCYNGVGAGVITNCTSGNIPYLGEQCLPGISATLQCNYGSGAFAPVGMCSVGNIPDTGCNTGSAAVGDCGTGLGVV